MQDIKEGLALRAAPLPRARHFPGLGNAQSCTGAAPCPLPTPPQPFAVPAGHQEGICALCQLPGSQQGSPVPDTAVLQLETDRLISTRGYTHITQRNTSKMSFSTGSLLIPSVAGGEEK